MPDVIVSVTVDNFMQAADAAAALTAIGAAADTDLDNDFVTLTDGATVTWAFGTEKEGKAQVTIAGNRTLAITGMPSGRLCILFVTQGSGGNRTLTLPANSKVVNDGSGAVELSTTAGDVDILTVVKRGANYYWNYGPKYT